MRTLKFRVYIKHWGGHGEFDMLEYPKKGELHVYFGNWERGGYKDAVFQQFTGLKDINDVDVYEGDLVEFNYATQPNIEESKGVYEVFYSQKDAAYYLRVYKKNWLDTSFVTQQDAKAKTIDANCPVQSLTELPLSQFKICKVIGNIFENPELLK